jgi:uncharacterized protein (DUF2236 family)
LEAATRALFDLGDQFFADFLRPAGESALVSPDSVSWRVFKNQLSLFIGGVAAVILQLAGAAWPDSADLRAAASRQLSGVHRS